jgi:hypothetical protein
MDDKFWLVGDKAYKLGIANSEIMGDVQGETIEDFGRDLVSCFSKLVGYSYLPKNKAHAYNEEFFTRLNNGE